MTTEQLWPPVAGKYGQTRNGRRVGPMRNAFEGGFYCQETGWYQGNGKWAGGVEGCEFDLISEWVDAPVPAHSIDFSKIKEGGEIEVRRRLKVDLIHEDGRPGVNFDGGFRYYKLEDLLAHIPASRPIEVGCHVISDDLPCSNPHRVLAIVDGSAWVKAGDHSQAVLPVGRLTRVDGEAA